MKEIYGVNKADLGTLGPSVVSLNGAVTSVGVTEFLVDATGIRPGFRQLTYYGEKGALRVNIDEGQEDCYFCRGIRGLREKANVERYIKENEISLFKEAV